MINRFAFFSLIMLCSCGNDNTKTATTQVADNTAISANLTALASEYCTCSVDLVALNKKAKYLAAHPDEIKNTDEISELLLQSEQLSQKQIECQNNIEQKYQTKIADNAEILKAIRISCPDLADFMENAKKSED